MRNIELSFLISNLNESLNCNNNRSEIMNKNAYKLSPIQLVEGKPNFLDPNLAI